MLILYKNPSVALPAGGFLFPEKVITMQELTLVRQEEFDGVLYDFYGGKSDFWMTRRQIGEALEYADPQKAIDKIHERHENRLNKFSTTVKLGVVEGGRNVLRDVIAYSRKGVFEICRWSEQPKADAFVDFVWDVMDGLLSGKYKIELTEKEKLRRANVITRANTKQLPYVLRELGIEPIVTQTETAADIAPTPNNVRDWCAENADRDFDGCRTMDVYAEYEAWAKNEGVFPVGTNVFVAEFLRCFTGHIKHRKHVGDSRVMCFRRVAPLDTTQNL